MREIRGHKSYSLSEIVAILSRTGTYTCPTLPHYRYDRVKSACWRLRKAKLLTVSGRQPEAVNLIVTPLFHEWMAAVAAGETQLGVLKWARSGVPGQSQPIE
jgi:hypothetical protein